MTWIVSFRNAGLLYFTAPFLPSWSPKCASFTFTLVICVLPSFARFSHRIFWQKLHLWELNFCNSFALLLCPNLGITVHQNDLVDDCTLLQFMPSLRNLPPQFVDGSERLRILNSTDLRIGWASANEFYRVPISMLKELWLPRSTSLECFYCEAPSPFKFAGDMATIGFLDTRRVNLRWLIKVQKCLLSITVLNAVVPDNSSTLPNQKAK